MKLGGLLKSLAPTIASAAGGPMAGMAVKMAAQKLGVPEATANEIEESTRFRCFDLYLELLACQQSCEKNDLNILYHNK